MGHTVGIPVGDLFEDIKLEVRYSLKENLAALREVERLESVLLSRKAALVASIADALVALARDMDALTCECGREKCDAAERPAPQPKPVELVVDLSLLADLSDLPAWLDGAPIDPDLARRLAAAATNIRFTTHLDTT